jgi:hypothetical protein
MTHRLTEVAPYYLTGLAFLLVWLSGRERTRGAGWLLGMFVLEPSWMIYGAVTHNPGWVFTAIPFIIFYGRNYWRHRHESGGAGIRTRDDSV